MSSEITCTTCNSIFLGGYSHVSSYGECAVCRASRIAEERIKEQESRRQYQERTTRSYSRSARSVSREKGMSNAQVLKRVVITVFISWLIVVLILGEFNGLLFSLALVPSVFVTLFIECLPKLLKSLRKSSPSSLLKGLGMIGASLFVGWQLPYWLFGESLFLISILGFSGTMTIIGFSMLDNPSFE